MLSFIDELLATRREDWKFYKVTKYRVQIYLENMDSRKSRFQISVSFGRFVMKNDSIPQMHQIIIIASCNMTDDSITQMHQIVIIASCDMTKTIT